MSGSRQALLRTLAQEIGALPQTFPRVAIDGVDGAGKSRFADDLAVVIRALQRPVIRASVDGFHQPRARRYAQGRHSPRGFFMDSYDYAQFKACLLTPLAPGGSGYYRTAAFDHTLDLPRDLPPQQALPGSILLCDGIFLHRPELYEDWTFSIFLAVDFEVSVARCAARDGTSPDPNAPSNHRYVAGQRLYFETCAPAQKASVVIDYNDLENPRIIRP